MYVTAFVLALFSRGYVATVHFLVLGLVRFSTNGYENVFFKEGAYRDGIAFEKLPVDNILCRLSLGWSVGE